MKNAQHAQRAVRSININCCSNNNNNLYKLSQKLVERGRSATLKDPFERRRSWRQLEFPRKLFKWFQVNNAQIKPPKWTGCIHYSLAIKYSRVNNWVLQKIAVKFKIVFTRSYTLHTLHTYFWLFQYSIYFIFNIFPNNSSCVFIVTLVRLFVLYVNLIG